MFNLRECMIFHTDFAEDLFQYSFEEIIELKLKNNCFESEKIDVQSIFEYCKKKYNYKNDEMHYFKNVVLEVELRAYSIYFDIINYKIIIPFDDTIDDRSIIKIGELNSSYKDKIINEKELYFKI